MARPARTLLEVAVARVGGLRGGRVIAFMVAWDVSTRDLGHDPTVEEYAEWWKVSRSTAYRELRFFRQAFPHERDPSRIMGFVRASSDAPRKVKAVGAISAKSVGIVVAS